MADSKAISIRLPDELLAKVNKLAEEKYKSIAGKPNKSLVVQNALIVYFDTLSDSVSNKRIVTEYDTVRINDFKALQETVATLSEDVKRLEQSLLAKSDTVIKSNNVKGEREEEEAGPLQLLDITLYDTVPNILTGAELAKRLGCSASSLSTKKGAYEENPEKFINWTKSLDPDGYGWEPREGGNKHAFRYHRIGKPPSLSEGGAEAQSSHP
jgi:metal-responsive CopG/Arc/MetJ family transcriptional regulator